MARLACWMPGNVATLTTCSGPWSFLICSIKRVVGEDDAVDPHVGAVALGDPPLARAGRLERSAISSCLAHRMLPLIWPSCLPIHDRHDNHIRHGNPTRDRCVNRDQVDELGSAMAERGWTLPDTPESCCCRSRGRGLDLVLGALRREDQLDDWRRRNAEAMLFHVTHGPNEPARTRLDRGHRQRDSASAIARPWAGSRKRRTRPITRSRTRTGSRAEQRAESVPPGQA